MPEESLLHEPKPTRQDLGRLAWAVAIIEAIIAGLAFLARSFFGPRLAAIVGLGLGGLVLAAFVLVVGFSLGATTVEELLGRREGRRK